MIETMRLCFFRPRLKLMRGGRLDVHVVVVVGVAVSAPSHSAIRKKLQEALHRTPVSLLLWVEIQVRRIEEKTELKSQAPPPLRVLCAERKLFCRNGVQTSGYAGWSAGHARLSAAHDGPRRGRQR